MFELKGRAGIITGASSGIGLAVSQTVAEAGARVYVISRSGKPKDPTFPIHQNIHYLKGDICDFALTEKSIDEIAAAGGIDFLINNAGITVKKRAERILPEDFDRVCRVNLMAPFELSRLCYPYLRQSEHVGRIINISSMAAHLGFSEVVPYCASKSGIVGLTHGLAVEWVNDNITVNSIAPGWFPSEMTKSVMDPARREKILSRMPMHRFGETKDIGALAQFLLSDSAAYITGCDYAVDGGALAFGF